MCVNIITLTRIRSFAIYRINWNELINMFARNLVLIDDWFRRRYVVSSPNFSPRNIKKSFRAWRQMYPSGRKRQLLPWNKREFLENEFQFCKCWQTARRCSPGRSPFSGRGISSLHIFYLFFLTSIFSSLRECHRRCDERIPSAFYLFFFKLF